jgi:hypothetical protein
MPISRRPRKNLTILAIHGRDKTPYECSTVVIRILSSRARRPLYTLFTIFAVIAIVAGFATLTWEAARAGMPRLAALTTFAGIAFVALITFGA